MRERPLTKTPQVHIPPRARDEWMAKANCYDQYPVTVDLCHDCPVVLECRALYEKLNSSLGIVTLDGVWGGHEHGVPLGTTNPGGHRYPKGSKPVNGGQCSVEGCDHDAYRKGICSMHYQRNKKSINDVVYIVDKGAFDD
jgi:hypothetical protein